MHTWWSKIYTVLLLYYNLRPVELQNFTFVTTTTEAIDFSIIDPYIYCKFQPNTYDCEGKGKLYHRFYYDLKLQDCKTSIIGSCPNNLNAFTTLSECHLACRDIGSRRLRGNFSAKIICRLQQDFGDCNGYQPMWYYDISTRRCKGFSYSGCGGNMNRFQTQQICATACSGRMGN